MRKFVMLAIAALLTMASTTALAAPSIGRSTKKRATKIKGKVGFKPALSTDEKLAALIGLQMTTAEIAIATGCSVRAIEARRRKLQNQTQDSGRISKTDERIDALYSLTSMLEARFKIPPHNVRAWFIGRSAYLGEQRPAVLLSSGEFELVRDAAIAYATSEAPDEFLDRVGLITRVPDPLDA